MGKILFICGECGAGKSTMSRAIGLLGCPVFHSSAVFSKIRERMPEGSDLESPEFANNLIHDAMWRFLDKHSPAALSVVETVPRSADQVRWIREAMTVFGDQSVFVAWLHAPKEVRRKRMSERCAERAEFDSARLGAEDAAKHAAIIHELSYLVPDGHLKFIRNDDGSDLQESVSKLLCQTMGFSMPEHSGFISAMMDAALNVYEERDGYEAEHARFDRMMTRVRAELDELEESRRLGKGKDDEKEEFADVMHFMFCLADSIGIASAELADVFWQKDAVNQARLQYPGEDKHSLNGRLTGDIRNAGQPV